MIMAGTLSVPLVVAVVGHCASMVTAADIASE